MSQEDFIKEAQEWAKDRKLPDPWKRFQVNALRAKERGIGWGLSFEEWWTLWKPHYANRGRKVGQKVMCRHLDSGDYRIGNVRIDTVTRNHVEYGVSSRLKKPQFMYGVGKDQFIPRVREMFSAPRPLRPDEALEVARGERKAKEDS